MVLITCQVLPFQDLARLAMSGSPTATHWLATAQEPVSMPPGPATRVRRPMRPFQANAASIEPATRTEATMVG